MEESSVSLSVCECKTLVDSVEENRQAAENLAMNTINSLQIPLLNSMLCLSKEDCKCILEWSNHCKNMIEQSLLLIAVTDFMSCVCANDEMFPLPLQSCDTSGIKSCLSKLKNSWCKFFNKIGVEDMSIDQMSSIMSLLRRCFERVPSEHYKIFMEVILKMSEEAMNRLNKSQKKVTFVDMEKKKGLIIGKDSSKEATSDIVSKQSNLQDKLKDHVPPSINNSNGKKSKSLSGDITRFILKPCENQVGPINVEEGGTPGKRKNEISSEKDPVTTAAVKENKNDSADLGSPPCKKHCHEDDLVDGKVNAFKQLMMAQKIQVKKNVIKIVVKK